MGTYLKYQGSVYEVPDEEVGGAVQMGATAASADDIRMAQASQQPVRAAVEGAARGFTMGLSDVALSKLEQDPKVLEARKAANPWASGVADVAGSAASFLTPAGPGKLLAGAVGKLGLKGAKKLAVEGTLVGLGQTIGQAAREDESLTAEKLAVGAGSGAVASVVLGKAFEGAGKLANRAGKALFGGKPAEQSLNEMSEGLLLRELGPSLSKQKNLGLDKYWSDIVELGRKEGVFAGRSLDSGRQAAEELYARSKAPIEQALNSLEQASPLQNAQVKTALERAKAYITGLPPGTPVTDLDKKLRLMTGSAGEWSSVLEPIDNLLKEGGAKWADLWKLQGDLGAKSEYGKRAAGAIKSVIYEAGKQAGPNIREPVVRSAQANALLELFSDASMREGAKAPTLSSVIYSGVQGLFAGGALAAWGVPGVGPVMGALGSMGVKAFGPALQEMVMFRGSEKLAKLAGSKAFTEMADGLAAHLKGVSPEALGRFGPLLASAAARGSQALLETHVELAKSRQGPEYLAAVGLQPETPREMGQAAQRLEHVEVLDQARARYEKVLDDSIAGFFKGGAGGGMPAAVNYEKKMAELTQKLMDPEAVAEKVPSTVYGAAPGVAMASAAHELRVAQFLADKAPKSPWAGAPQAIARPWKPSQSDLRVWAEYVEAAEQPGKVLASLKRGFISEPQREALQTLYPGVYAELQQRLTERLLEWKTPLSYRQRLLASKFLGSAALGMSPQQVMVLQSIHKKAGQASGAPQSAPDGRQKVDVEKNLQTQAQRLQER